MRVYLAGPEVFHVRAVEIGREKRAICAWYGHEGLYPIDPDAPASTLAGADLAREIFTKNVAMIRNADACVANLTAYQGIDADAGTAWEVGFAHALGKRLMGYANHPSEIVGRDATFRAADLERAAPAFFPLAATTAEDFGLTSNLMLIGAIEASGGAMLSGPPAPLDDLTLFEACVARL